MISALRYAIDNSRRTKHGALLDAELLAEVYVELIGARQAQLVLSQSATPVFADGEPIVHARTTGAACRTTVGGGARGPSPLYRRPWRQCHLARLRQPRLSGDPGGEGCAAAKRWR